MQLRKKWNQANMPAVDFEKIVVVQTAFAGDLILTLPMVQVLRRQYPNALIDVVVIPGTSGLLASHPAINRVIIYDKRGKDSGLAGLIRQVRNLRSEQYDLAVVPHRSLRSAALVRLAGIKERIGFNKSSGRFLYSKLVRYESFLHEIERNISLLGPLGIRIDGKEYPQLFPSFHDRKKVGLFLSENGIHHSPVAVAPGTVWNTKRWLEERFIELVEKLVLDGSHVVLIGGEDDAGLCRQILAAVPSKHLHSSAGKMSFLQSAELIRRCRVLITNDSAPLHLAAAMRTPAVAIFGATAPEYGFAPYGEDDQVVQTFGLKCRPCSIHGGDKCPIGTFDCMRNISSGDVLRKVLPLVHRTSTPGAAV